MFPDLGKYAFDVLLAYGVTLFFLALLVIQSVWVSKRIKKRLAEEEAQKDA